MNEFDTLAETEMKKKVVNICGRRGWIWMKIWESLLIIHGVQSGVLDETTE